jgi:hypothetical protein
MVDRVLTRADVGQPIGGSRLQLANSYDGSFLLPALRHQILVRRGIADPPGIPDEWRELVADDALRAAFGDVAGGDTGVVLEWRVWARESVDDQTATCIQSPGESPEAFKIRRNNFICDSGVERALSRMTNTRRGG